MTPATVATVVVCAYTENRWNEINAAIASVLEQAELDRLIVVVDHNEALLVRIEAAWPKVTIVANRYKQGLSGARNTGIDLCTSDIVAFLDDDATASAGWLSQLLDAFDSDGVVAVGGRAQPRWPHGKASVTLPPELLWVVGCTYLGQPQQRSEVRNVIGCSMAFRRDPLAEVGGFNVDTGRVGTIPLGAEETETCIRLTSADPARRIIFEPRSVVHHSVTADRMTWRYLARRCFYEGISKSGLSRDLGSRDALSSERQYVLHVLPAGVLRELVHGRPLGALAIQLSVIAAGVGYLYGSFRGKAEPADEAVAVFTRVS